MLNTEHTALPVPSLQAAPKRNIGPGRSVPDRERGMERAFGDTAIDWERATPSWSAMFWGIILPIFGALATLAAVVVVLYFLNSKGMP